MNKIPNNGRAASKISRGMFLGLGSSIIKRIISIIAVKRRKTPYP